MLAIQFPLNSKFGSTMLRKVAARLAPRNVRRVASMRLGRWLGTVTVDTEISITDAARQVFDV